ncbi:hypothetical protein TNCT_517471 [Trichonephila clavata]|uniref:Uncharacterized protein n=1 Tax=Trichonephila clavata TaxID=2740835 RepID=A0A8X6M0P9_TRICU|nr:hypothetical protein TNCT_517471 [Trichonephila clavata]
MNSHIVRPLTGFQNDFQTKSSNDKTEVSQKHVHSAVFHVENNSILNTFLWVSFFVGITQVHRELGHGTRIVFLCIGSIQYRQTSRTMKMGKTRSLLFEDKTRITSRLYFQTSPIVSLCTFCYLSHLSLSPYRVFEPLRKHKSPATKSLVLTILYYVVSAPSKIPDHSCICQPSPFTRCLRRCSN